MTLPKFTPRLRQFLLHIAWWVFFIGNFFIAQYVRNPNYEWYLIDMGLYFLSDILFFYFFINVTAKYLFNRRTLWIGICLFFVNASILYGIEASRVIWAYFAGFYDQIPKYYFQLHTLVLAYLRDVIQFTGYGTLYWFYNRFYEQQKEKLALEQKKHDIEIKFLRGQINDHFTYNLLNMFHSQASIYSEQLADGILTLSDLMRYSVAEKENMMVHLVEEMTHVSALMELNRQRFGLKADIRLVVEGDISPWQVPHLSVLTIVENCFKHGAITKGSMLVQLKASKEQVMLLTQNRIKAQTEKQATTGLGLSNLERRLELLCPGRTSLRYWKEEEVFFTELLIKGPQPPKEA